MGDEVVDPVTKRHRTMFLVAAIFNFVCGSNMFRPAFIFDLLDISPLPEEGMVLHLCALLVAGAGLGYYNASQDLPYNAKLIWLSMWGKFGVVAVSATDVLLGIISWQIMLVTFWDFVFAILFYRALSDLEQFKKTSMKL